LLGELDEGAAADALHGEVGDALAAVVVDAGLVDLGDAGVLESSEDVGLVLEASEECGGGPAGADDLEGDGAFGALLLGEVDLAHTALAEGAEDAVVAEVVGASDGLGGRLGVSGSVGEDGRILGPGALAGWLFAWA